MLALIGAVLVALYALGVEADAVLLNWLGIAFFFAHFAWGWAPWGRRGNPPQ
jgi:hypothetical protein